MLRSIISVEEEREYMRYYWLSMFVFLLFIVYTSPTYAAENSMKVHFINVGQGDSILIQTPEKSNILIDGGPPEASDSLTHYLKEQGVTTLDLLIATHPDIDHIGGLLSIIQRFPVKEVWDSGKFYYTRTYHRYFRQIKKRNIPLYVAKLHTVKSLADQVSLTVLNANSIMKTNNQSSLALQLTYNQIDFLLMADIEKKQELNIIQRTDVASEIIKIAHHGSDTSSSFAFLQAVDPDIAILSYDTNNKYGHPARETVEHLLKVGATIYSTAKTGNIIITTNGEQYQIHNTGVDHLITKPLQ